MSNASSKSAPQSAAGRGAAYLDPAILERIKTLELFARGVVEGNRIGMHRSLLHGLSTEFTHHRPYVPGDGLRHIDWRVYSKTDRYYMKQFEAETNFDAYFLFDASSSMHYGFGKYTKLEYAKHLAAALAYMIVHQGDSVGLGVFDGELRDYIHPQGTKSVIGSISELLHDTEGRPRTDVAGILEEFAMRIKRRGFVMMFSDLFDHEQGFIDGLNRLAFTGQHIIVFQVLDHDELTFSFDGIVRFQGLEGEAEIKLQPEQIRADYLAVVDELTSLYRQACRDINADYVLVDTSRPVQDVLIEYLNARRLLKWRR